MQQSVVYKYPVIKPTVSGFYGHWEVLMPKGAKIISTHCAGYYINLYAQVDPMKPADQIVSVYIAGTGTELPYEVVEHYRFIGTVQQGEYIWHIYVLQAHDS